MKGSRDEVPMLNSNYCNANNSSGINLKTFCLFRNKYVKFVGCNSFLSPPSLVVINIYLVFFYLSELPCKMIKNRLKRLSKIISLKRV